MSVCNQDVAGNGLGKSRSHSPVDPLLFIEVVYEEAGFHFHTFGLLTSSPLDRERDIVDWPEKLMKVIPLGKSQSGPLKRNPL